MQEPTMYLSTAARWQILQRIVRRYR